MARKKAKAGKKKKEKKTARAKIKTKTKQAKPFKALLIGESIASSEKEAKNLYSQSSFGEPAEKKIYYSLVEALYLLEKKKLVIYNGKKKLTPDSFLKIACKLEPNFHTRFVVYRSMRNKGYIIKTALKFGADFRVYERGIKPGQDHAKWILYAVPENSVLTWHEFAAKNRVAHSTRKRLLIGIVDEEQDVVFYEVRWLRP